MLAGKVKRIGFPRLSATSEKPSEENNTFNTIWWLIHEGILFPAWIPHERSFLQKNMDSFDYLIQKRISNTISSPYLCIIGDVKPTVYPSQYQLQGDGTLSDYPSIVALTRTVFGPGGRTAVARKTTSTNPAWIPHESDWRVAHLLGGRHSFGINFSCSLKVLFCPCGHWKALWSLASKVWDFQTFHPWRPQASNFKASDSLACVMKYFLFLKLPPWILKANCISVTTPNHLCFIEIKNFPHEFSTRISIQLVSFS